MAGTVFVHKVAGAAAASGASLEEVAAEARVASMGVGSMGVALTVCTVPGNATSDRLGEAEMEVRGGGDGGNGHTWMNGWMVDGWMDEWVNGWVGGYGWMDGWTMCGWMK